MIKEFDKWHEKVEGVVKRSESEEKWKRR